MSEYVLAFRQGQTQGTPQSEQEWTDWFASIGEHIVDWGRRVGQTQMVGEQAAATDRLGGFVIVAADSLDAAARIAEGCPGLRHGGRVEVGTVVPAQ